MTQQQTQGGNDVPESIETTCPCCDGAGCSECENTGHRTTTFLTLDDGTVARVKGSGPLSAESQAALEDVARVAARKLIDRDGQVAATKDNLLRQIEHLRRTVEYDYPPRVVAPLIRSVRTAAKHHREAWESRPAP